MIKFRIPATSANLGTGFDTLGMALTKYNYLTVSETEEPTSIISNMNVPTDDRNLIYKTIKDFFEITGKSKVPNLKIVQEDYIPMTRGLGSSAACIVGGIYAGNYLAQTNLSKDEMAEIASNTEGHPDNVTPAVYGGIVVGALEDEKLYTSKICTKKFEELEIVVMVPNFIVKTSESRAILPSEYSMKDVVHNISRAALLVNSIATGDFEKFDVAMNDKLHQPYRMSIINNMDIVLKKAKELGAVSSFLSGAGPTLISLTKDTNFLYNMGDFIKQLDDEWTIEKLKLDSEGAKIIK